MTGPEEHGRQTPRCEWKGEECDAVAEYHREVKYQTPLDSSIQEVEAHLCEKHLRESDKISRRLQKMKQYSEVVATRELGEDNEQ